jgi:predicted RNA-binding protein associated with RNAse of E/G family
MRKKEIERRIKFTTNTYMKEALKYEITIIKEEDYFITIKKYLELTKPVIISDIRLIDKDYYLVEITPLNEKYNIRFYLDDKKNIIDYYIDITYKNGVKNMIPYYVDLYLDILHFPRENKISFVDENELEEALQNKLISKKDYDNAYKVGNKLLNEIKNNKNKYYNIDVIKYIDKYYK